MRRGHRRKKSSETLRLSESEDTLLHTKTRFHRLQVGPMAMPHAGFQMTEYTAAQQALFRN